MTTASVALPRPLAPSTQDDSWGRRIAEFMLVGGMTLVLYPLALLYRRSAGLDDSQFMVSYLAFYAAHVINDPHFSVTYLLFYKDVKKRALGDAFDPVQRLRYVVAGFLVPLILAVWAGMAIAHHSGVALGLMIQLMFFLVGWHYVKQGFGVVTVLSARRGVRFGTLERRVILTHCFAGWAYGWASPADSGSEFVESGLVYRSLAHPPHLETITGVIFALSTVALLGVLARKSLNDRRVPPLGPIGGLLISIWLWTVYSSFDPLMMYVIPTLHSIQYLYFVWLLKRGETREAAGPPNFKAPVLRLALLVGSALMLGWILFRSGPQFLDEHLVLTQSPELEGLDPLGPTPYLAAIGTFVNIHHYFMDHVIWRRENPETRFLRH
jgi:hypothetical protein